MNAPILLAAGVDLLAIGIVIVFIIIPLIGVVTSKLREISQPQMPPRVERNENGGSQEQIDEFLRRASQRRAAARGGKQTGGSHRRRGRRPSGKPDCRRGAKVHRYERFPPPYGGTRRRSRPGRPAIQPAGAAGVQRKSGGWRCGPARRSCPRKSPTGTPARLCLAAHLGFLARGRFRAGCPIGLAAEHRPGGDHERDPAAAEPLKRRLIFRPRPGTNRPVRADGRIRHPGRPNNALAASENW